MLSMVLVSYASLPASVTLPRLAPAGTARAQTHQCRTCPRTTVPGVLAPDLHPHGSRTHWRGEGTGKNVLYFPIRTRCGEAEFPRIRAELECEKQCRALGEMLCGAGLSDGCQSHAPWYGGNALCRRLTATLCSCLHQSDENRDK